MLNCNDSKVTTHNIFGPKNKLHFLLNVINPSFDYGVKYEQDIFLTCFVTLTLVDVKGSESSE